MPVLNVCPKLVPEKAFNFVVLLLRVFINVDFPPDTAGVAAL
jgi:hypothetical protein